MARRQSRSASKRGGDLGVLATAAVPFSLLALSKYYGSRKGKTLKSLYTGVTGKLRMSKRNKSGNKSRKSSWWS